MHVLGRRQGALVKNAVDVKMAVDAVSYVSSLPHIDVYVIVSGDRDFIHVLKELRRHGKTVVGVSPSSAVSRDFSALCDRFVRYEALTSTAEPVDAEGDRQRPLQTRRYRPQPSRRAPRQHGQDDAAPCPVVDLRRERLRIRELLAVPPADGRRRARRPRRPPPAATCASTRSAATRRPPRTPDPADIDGLARRANLHKSRYERNTRRRRATLAALFDVMAAADAPFRLVDMPDEMRERGGDDAMSLTDLVKYARVLHVGRAFALEADPEDIPFRERPMSLAADVRSPEDFVVAYETAIAARLLRAAGESPVGTAHPRGPPRARRCGRGRSRVLRRTAGPGASDRAIGTGPLQARLVEPDRELTTRATASPFHARAAVLPAGHGPVPARSPTAPARGPATPRVAGKPLRRGR